MAKRITNDQREQIVRAAAAMRDAFAASPQAPAGQQAEHLSVESFKRIAGRFGLSWDADGCMKISIPVDRADRFLAALAGQQSERPAPLLELLARIHRDGGHYVEQHGLEKAVADADAQIVRWLSMEAERPAPAGQAVGAYEQAMNAAKACGATVTQHEVGFTHAEFERFLASQAERPAVQQAAASETLREALKLAVKTLAVYMDLPSDRWPGPPTSAMAEIETALAAELKGALEAGKEGGA